MVVTILEGALGIFFLVAGFMKLLGHAHMVEEFHRFQYPLWLMRLAGALEVLAAPGLLLGRWLPGWALLGALVLCAVMVGAAYTNFTRRPAVFGWGTLVLLALCGLPVVTRLALLRSWLA